MSGETGHCWTVRTVRAVWPLCPPLSSAGHRSEVQPARDEQCVTTTETDTEGALPSLSFISAGP